MTKILVADDNEQNIYLLKVLLESNGYELITARNGLEALKAARNNKPDLIISDILMPGLDGFGFCRNIKTDDNLKDIPFIFYTATYTDAEDEELALSLGAEKFVRKPAESNKFILIVADILKQHRHGKLADSAKEPETEDVFYKKYNAALVRKMEDKMLELELANKRLAALFHISVDLTLLLPGEDLIRAILTKVIDVIGCSHANYFEFNENKKTLKLKVIVGYPDRNLKKDQDKLTFKLGEKSGLVGLVGKNQEPLIIDDTYQDPRWIKVDKSIKSALFLPLVSENRLIGVLSFLDTRVGKFDEKIFRDLTTLSNNMAMAIQKRRFVEKIQDSEHRYRILVENSIDAIIPLDQNYLITDWNRGAEEIFNYSKNEMVGKPFETILPEKNRREMVKTLKEGQKKGFKRRLKTKMLAKAKEVIDVELTFTVTYLRDEIGYTAIVRNITN